MRLSDHFTLAEFVKSPTADRHGIDNTPPEDVVENLRQLCIHVLEPVRQQFGPVSVNSGYRCPELNAAVGSKPTSQHTRGQAADFECPPHDNAYVAAWIRDHLQFDQLILEFYKPSQPLSGWVHCSWAGPKNRGSIISINSTGTHPGLVS